MRFLYLLILLLQTVLNCRAQQYPMLHYNVDDGLPGNMVYFIHPDRNGYIWLATDKGLARFDGKQFESFNTYDGLPDNEVFELQDDYEGRMWIGTYNGRLSYYKNGRFYSEKDDPLLKLPFKGSMINQIRVEKDSSITFFFYNREHFINISHNVRHIYSLRKLGRMYDKLGIVYIKKKGPGIYEIGYDKRTMVIDTNINILSNIPRDNLLRFGKRDALATTDSLYDKNRKFIHTLKKSFWETNLINQVYIDNGHYYMATQQGVFLDSDTPVMEQMRFGTVRKDAEGNFWIGSLDNGVYILDKNFRKIKYHPHIFNEEIKYAHVDSTGLFVCTQDRSLYKYAHDTLSCVFNATNHIASASGTYRNCYTIEGDTYYSATMSSDKHITVSHIHGKPQVSARYVYPSYARKLFTKDKYLYAVGNNDAYRYKVKEFTQLGGKVHVERICDSPGRELLYGMAQAKDRSIWYSTISEVYKVTDSKPILQKQFRGAAFRAMCIAGDYLVGYTHTNDLLVCNHFEDKGIQIDTVHGESCIWDKIYKLDRNHVLINTNNLYRVLTLHSSAGKPSFTIQALENPFLPLHADYICSDGRTCYFISKGSLTEIATTDLLMRPQPPQPLFTSLKTVKRSYAADSNLSISYNEGRYLEIGIDAPVFRRNVLYEYSIAHNGDEDMWVPLSGKHINLYNPGYGNYVVKVRAKTISSAYSEPHGFYLHIGRPFWAQWWFYLLCFAIVTAGVWVAVHYRIRYTLHKKEAAHNEKVKFIRSEYKALNALMNPHFIFNAMNSVQWLINSDNKQHANKYLRLFSGLLRQNMHNLSQELIPLEKEITLISHYLELEKLRFKECLNYEITIADEIDTEEILVPPMLVQPIVENAIKHGLFPRQSEDNYLSVNIYEEGTKLVIEITDNGIGLHHSSRAGNGHQSFSIGNIKRRIEQLAMMHDIHITLSINELALPDGTVEGTKAVITIVHPLPE